MVWGSTSSLRGGRDGSLASARRGVLVSSVGRVVAVKNDLLAMPLTRSGTSPGAPESPFDALVRRIEDSGPERRIAGRNSTKADILVYRFDDRRVVVKDYGLRPWWVRQVLGRWQTGRECRAYRALAGVAGLPEYLGRLGPWRLALSFVDGRPLADLPAGSLPDTVFDRLEQIVADVHRQGVVLVDLHHRDVLVDDRGVVHVLDLAAARVGERDPSRRGRLQRRLERLDRLQLVRLRARFGVSTSRRRWPRRIPSSPGGIVEDAG